MSPAVLLHGCDLLLEQSLQAVLTDAGHATSVWDATRPTCVPGQQPLLVLAGTTGSARCRAGCSRCLRHWRQHHPDRPVVLVGPTDQCRDWSVPWEATPEELLACLRAAAEGRRP